MKPPAIRLFPDPVLRKTAEPVTVFDAKLKDLAQTLAKVMESQPLGIGIAAPQVGWSKQLAVVDVSARVPGAKRLFLVNPVVLEVWEEHIRREGCMSLPEYTAHLKRYSKVLVRWQDLEGTMHEETFEGLEAVCIQHEVDHLNGQLFIDRVSFLKRDLIPRVKPSKD